MMYSIVLTFLCGFQIFGESPISKIDGLFALRQLVLREASQDEIEVDPDQLQALTELLNSERLKTLMEREAAVFPPLRTNKKSVDDFIRNEMQKILSPDQMAKRRLFSAKREFVTPMALFRSDVLNEFGVSPSLCEKIESSTTSRFRELTLESPRIRKKSISELVEHMSDDSIRRFATLFGGSLLDGRSKPEDVDPKVLRIFKESSPTSQLRMMEMTMLPEPFALSTKQFSAIQDLARKQAIRIAKSPSTPFDSVIETEMNGILRRDQIVALLRATHHSLLMKDMSILERRECTDFLNLSDDAIKSLRELVEKSNRSYYDARQKAFREIFEIGIEMIPIESRNRVNEYFKSVWN